MTLLDLPASRSASAAPEPGAGGAQFLSVDQTFTGALATGVGGESDHLTGHPACDPHSVPAGEVQISPGGQGCTDPQTGFAVRAQTPPAEAVDTARPVHAAPRLADPLLTIRAAILDDLEKVRTANTNRLGVLTRPAGTLDKDGEERGWGLPEDAPEVRSLRVLVKGIEALEHAAVLDLQRAMRKHPLGAWVKATVGVGEKQAARLLSAIGDPYWNTLHNRPRTVSELWAYCGLHTLPGGLVEADAQYCGAAGSKLPGGDEGQLRCDPQARAANVAPRRRKGQKANWSTTAKTRAYLIAESCIKQARSPYRAVYDARRAHTAVTHPDWTAGHSHSDALRITSKAILRDLWIAARDLHAKDA